MTHSNFSPISLKRVVKPYLWRFFDKLIPRTFGQLGEDAVIANHLEWLGLNPNKPDAYADIGAFHPTRGSNTDRFYMTGSHGFAFDIGARKKHIWRISRPRDMFFNAALVPESWKIKTVSVRTAALLAMLPIMSRGLELWIEIQMRLCRQKRYDRQK